MKAADRASLENQTSKKRRRNSRKRKRHLSETDPLPLHHQVLMEQWRVERAEFKKNEDKAETVRFGGMKSAVSPNWWDHID